MVKLRLKGRDMLQIELDRIKEQQDKTQKGGREKASVLTESRIKKRRNIS